ncbi:MAG: hypothetical protein KDC66_00670 [Phaeodactylibacter sp.]|nr:hypothetical protein [Phaeodactylibacter sp.]MCB9273277.1 hypothetical protein [Lewinellaceae bacterium]
MSVTSHPEIPLWIQNRIVGFFNWARNVDMILDGTIQDDPSDGPGSTMGRTLAARILRERNGLPGRRFTDLEQIDSIRGVGPGTIRDLVYSFGASADEVFRKALYESGTIYMENWPLEYFRFTIDDQQEFVSIAQDNEKLRQFVVEKVDNVCRERAVASEKCEAMLTELRTAYIDEYSNSTPIAGYALALWFYDFDADNWFSWEQIQEQTIAYFDHNSNTYPWFMSLNLFKGFRNRGIISPGICPACLPVVVNWAEQAVTFWVSALYD